MQPEAGALDQTLEAAQRGDVAAFNVLVQAFQRQVYNVCYRTLGNSEDAADASQDAFVSAFRGLKSFKGSASGLRSWLLRIAVNVCYDQVRRKQRRPAESLDAQQDHEISIVDPAQGPEQHSLGAETARHIQEAIDQLPPEQRLAVVLCDVQGLSYDEAADVMAVELGTVKSRLSRARAQLRVLLTEKGELPASATRLQEERRQ